MLAARHEDDDDDDDVFKLFSIFFLILPDQLVNQFSTTHLNIFLNRNACQFSFLHL